MENPNLTENTVPNVLEGEYCRKHHGALRKIMKTHESEQSRECNWGNIIENIALVTLENSMQNTIITIPVLEYV